MKKKKMQKKEKKDNYCHFLVYRCNIITA